MRSTVLSLAAVALIASACAAGSTSGPYSGQREQPQHRYPPPATSFPDAQFEDPGVNPYVDPRDDRDSTFALDVDTGSYTIARSYVEAGAAPDPASVRIEEYVNYFEQGYDLPDDGTFAIHADGGPTPFLDRDEVLLRIGIQARDVGERARPDAHLTFVIDVSGSMADSGKLELVKEALGLLVDHLRDRDTVAIVVYSTDARVELEPTPAADRGAILSTIDRLHPEGSTNAEAGLRLGYDLAHEVLDREGINRVVLASDGVANVGLTDPDGIVERIRRDAEAGIQLVSIGVGMGTYNDVLLEQLADRGDGFYAYVDTLDEAKRVFVDDLTGTLLTVALDARVQVEFDERTVEAYRLVGFENRDLADEAFRDPEVDAGAIGAGHAVTALYALELAANTEVGDRIGTVGLRWYEPGSDRATELARDVEFGELATRFEASDPHFQLDAIVAAAGEVLRDSRYARGYDLHDVLDEARAASLPEGESVDEFLGLLRAATRLKD